jgi:hypothetical protein
MISATRLCSEGLARFVLCQSSTQASMISFFSLLLRRGEVQSNPDRRD